MSTIYIRNGADLLEFLSDDGMIALQDAGPPDSDPAPESDTPDEYHFKTVPAGTTIVFDKVDLSDHNGPPTIFCNGTEENPVLIKGSPNNLISGKTLRFTGQHFIIDGLRVNVGDGYGAIKLEGSLPSLGPATVKNVMIQNCNVSGGFATIWGEHTENVIVQRNYIHDGVPRIMPGPDDDWGNMGCHFINSANVTIINNYFWGFRAGSPDYNSDGEMVNLRNVRRATIRNNSGWGTPSGIEMGGFAPMVDGNRVAKDVLTDILYAFNAVYSMPEDRPEPGKFNSTQAFTIHTPEPYAGKPRRAYQTKDMQDVEIVNNKFWNMANTSGSTRYFYLQENQQIPETMLSHHDNNYVPFAIISRNQFFAANGAGWVFEPASADGVGGTGNTGGTEPPTPEPPTPNPPSATGTITVRMVATMDGQTLDMPDALTSITVPATGAISESEQALLDIYRQLTTTQRALVQNVASALLG